MAWIIPTENIYIFIIKDSSEVQNETSSYIVFKTTTSSKLLYCLSIYLLVQNFGTYCSSFNQEHGWNEYIRTNKTENTKEQENYTFVTPQNPCLYELILFFYNRVKNKFIPNIE